MKCEGYEDIVEFFKKQTTTVATEYKYVNLRRDSHGRES
jgi:hypothetical protein